EGLVGSEMCYKRQGLEKEDVSPYLKFYENDGAVEHLFRVACGLDSMVIGETQILGQVRSSFKVAQELSLITSPSPRDPL
ncbi:hypothetical protein ACQ4LK_26015, partial [Bacillus pumilus]